MTPLAPTRGRVSRRSETERKAARSSSLISTEAHIAAPRRFGPQTCTELPAVKADIFAEQTLTSRCACLRLSADIARSAMRLIPSASPTSPTPTFVKDPSNGSARVHVLAILLIAASSCGSTPCKALSAAGTECCPERGRDACVGGSYCGLESGRTVPTCLSEGRITTGDYCDFDEQCRSGKCVSDREYSGCLQTDTRCYNPDKKRCLSAVGESCGEVCSGAEMRHVSPSDRCAPSPLGSTHCSGTSGKCEIVVGVCRAPCLFDLECTGQRKCLGAVVGSCNPNTASVYGSCSCP